MNKPKVYIETTLFSSYYEEREYDEYRKLRANARAFFSLAEAGIFELYSSNYVLLELENEENETHRVKMIGLFNSCGAHIITASDEIDALAQMYLERKVMSPTWGDDARHIATTAVEGLDFIVSQNFTHIVRPWTIGKVATINAEAGYRQIGIYRPEEVVYEYSR